MVVIKLLVIRTKRLGPRSIVDTPWCIAAGCSPETFETSRYLFNVIKKKDIMFNWGEE